MKILITLSLYILPLIFKAPESLKAVTIFSVKNGFPCPFLNTSLAKSAGNFSTPSVYTINISRQKTSLTC